MQCNGDFFRLTCTLLTVNNYIDSWISKFKLVADIQDELRTRATWCYMQILKTFKVNTTDQSTMCSLCVGKGFLTKQLLTTVHSLPLHCSFTNNQKANLLHLAIPHRSPLAFLFWILTNDITQSEWLNLKGAGSCAQPRPICWQPGVHSATDQRETCSPSSFAWGLCSFWLASPSSFSKVPSFCFLINKNVISSFSEILVSQVGPSYGPTEVYPSVFCLMDSVQNISVRHVEAVHIANPEATLNLKSSRQKIPKIK